MGGCPANCDLARTSVGWGHDPTDALMGLSIRFFPETHRLAPIFTTQLLNLVGGGMTPPYDGLPDKPKFDGVRKD